MKTLFYNTIKIFLCIFSLLIPTTQTICFDMSNLSPQEMEQMKQFEQELMEASRAIEEAVAQMSPEEQEEFNRAVAEMTKILEEMPEEEFDSFLEELFSTEFDESMFEELAGQMEKPQEELPAQKEVVVSLDEFKDVITLLDSIAKQLNNLLVKISSSPDASAKLVHWRDQNKIQHWSKDISWSMLRTKIETFASTLLRMKKVDEKTKKALFLPFIKDDKSLINNLTELNKKLLQFVPVIEIPEFGLEKISLNSKLLLQKTMSVITESLFVTKIPEALLQVEEKFAPEAKKLAEQEEKLEKEAGARMARPTGTRQTIVAGKEESGYAISGTPSYEQSGGAYRGAPSAYSPTSSGRDSYRSGDRQGVPSDKKGAPDSSANKTEKKGKDKSKTEKDLSKTEQEESTKKAKELEDKQANKYFEKVVTEISELAQLIKENKDIQNIAKDIKKPFDKNSGQIDFTDLQRKIKSINGNLDALNTRVKTLSKSAEAKTYYQKLLQEKIKTEFGIIESFINNISAIKKIYTKNKKDVSDIKRLVYLFDQESIAQERKKIENNPEELKKFETDLSLLVPLFEIEENLTTLLAKIKDLSYKPKTQEEIKKEEEQKTKAEKKDVKKPSKESGQKLGTPEGLEQQEALNTPEGPQEPDFTVEQLKEMIQKLEAAKVAFQEEILNKSARASEYGESPDVEKEKQEIAEIDQALLVLKQRLKEKKQEEKGGWFDWLFGSSEEKD